MKFKIFFFTLYLALSNTTLAQITDINGQNYQTVVIGSQTWMSENLNTNKFRNGNTIPEAKSAEEWKKACENYQPAWCYYNNDPTNEFKYGKLYNFWAVIDARGIAPNGWRVPKDSDFKILLNHLGTTQFSETELGAKPVYKTDISYNKIPAHPEETYVTCDNCSYWTKEQKKYNPCTKCKNQGKYIVKTGKIIPEKTEKIEKKTLLSGFENGLDKYGFNLPASGRRTISDFSGAGNSISKGSYLWSSDFYSKSDYGNAQYIGRSIDYSDRTIYQGYSIRCLKGENEEIGPLNSEAAKKYNYVIFPEQYSKYYSENNISLIGTYLNELLSSNSEIKFISIKTEFICNTTSCCGYLDYLYTGIDGKDDIIGYKITKDDVNGENKLFFSSISASTSQYNQSANLYGPVELIKKTDLLYETTDGRYKLLFQFTNIHCDTNNLNFVDNLHFKIIDSQKEFNNIKLGYKLNWIENIGGAHWSGYNGSSISGHNQNIALEKVNIFLNE